MISIIKDVFFNDQYWIILNYQKTISNYFDFLNSMIKLLMYIENIIKKLITFNNLDLLEKTYYRNEIKNIINNINRESIKYNFDIDREIFIKQIQFSCILYNLQTKSNFLSTTYKNNKYFLKDINKLIDLDKYDEISYILYNINYQLISKVKYYQEKNTILKYHLNLNN